MLSKTDFTDQVGKRIKKWRIKRGLSQEELAHRARLYRTYVRHLENARYSPRVYILYKIAKALKVELRDLFP